MQGESHRLRMKKIYSFTKFLVLTLLLSSFVFPNEALAYIDAGSGSYVAQVLIGIVLGSLFAFKNFWTKLRSMIFKHKPEIKKAKQHGRSNQK